MTTDDLSAPLGQGRQQKPRAGARSRVPYLIAGLVVFAAALFAVWTVARDHRFGGQPVASAPVEPASPPVSAEGTAPVATPALPLRQAMPAKPAQAGEQTTGSIPSAELQAEPGMTTVTIIDGSSGKRRKVIVPDSKTTATPARER